ncbi:UNVERIFIED_CONTAM: hypothetical protein Cloal_2904 [Acetivibrio alkalicellulosi]
MKIKLFFISMLIDIFLIGIGIYSIMSFGRVTISHNIQNDITENIDSKTENTDTINIKSNFLLDNEDFVIKYKNNHIELGGKYGDLKTNEKITKAIPANEKSVYDIYMFENFKIITQPDGKANGYILSIDLTTPIIQTPRGIRIGDTISNVLEKYGDSDDCTITDTSKYYVYRYRGNVLTFFVNEKEEVIGIRFEIV